MGKHPTFIPFLFLFLVTNFYSQNRFQEGYYISNEGEKIHISIEKKNWKSWSNEYLTIRENSRKIKLPLKNISEFGIETNLKFIRRGVNIEKSRDRLKNLEDNNRLEFVKEDVLLKVLVEGRYSLYLYLDDNIRKFFFRDGKNSDITQLIYKRSMQDSLPATIIKNINYQEQLKVIQSCPDTNPEDLIYNQEKLKQFFIAQNKCTSLPPEFIDSKILKNKFELIPSAGLISAFINVKRGSHVFNFKNLSPTFGLNFKYLIPVVSNAFSINLDLQYNSVEINDEVKFDYSNNLRRVTINHSELLTGAGGDFRYYLNNVSSLDFGARVYFPLILKDTRYQETVSNLDITNAKTHPVLGISTGYNFKRFSLRFGATTGNNFLTSTNNFNLSLSRLSLRVGYNLLN